MFSFCLNAMLIYSQIYSLFVIVNALHSIKINCRIPSSFVSALNFDLFKNFLESFTQCTIHALYVLINSQNNHFNYGKISFDWRTKKSGDWNSPSQNAILKDRADLIVIGAFVFDWIHDHVFVQWLNIKLNDAFSFSSFSISAIVTLFIFRNK